MSTRAHKQAVLALLATDPQLEVYEGAVPPKATRYVRLHWPPTHPVDERLASVGSAYTFEFFTESVGSTPDQAQWVADRLFAVLFNQRVQVPGRVSRRIKHESSTPVDEDKSVSPWRYVAEEAWQLTTEAQ